MTLGQSFGEILLEIAQTSIQNGNPEKAIKIYTESLHGFTEDYVIRLLKNEFVLITSEDKVSVELTDNKDIRACNKENVIVWYSWLKYKLNDIIEIVKSLNGIKRDFNECTHASILDYDINEPVIQYFGKEVARAVGIHNIAAKLIAGDSFSNLASNGENIWGELVEKVESHKGEKYQEALYFIVRYVELIRVLHKMYLCFIKSYSFLRKNNLANRPTFIEDKLEAVLETLTNFANTSKGYYHPMCNTKLYKYKEQIDDDILSTDFGKEYRRYGIIEKNIMDGYDAGWLSPDGVFYGDNGPTSSMIHLRIAEILNKGDWNGDRILEEKGWIKIHGNEVYGTFIGISSTEDFSHPYCPTEIQIKMVCDYIDKFYNGKMFTQPQIVRNTEPISTYKIRQMDKIMLHNIFGI